ncbi:hypothetical protein AVEN_134241-1 [Araneus ventricosus]|uniref:Uncharacterized protein n=1 Tax=Araneus ventricosus TaxID=182803 RepID=A0A4Y2ISQ0_ARAVE|nr:hypothetical protein AVEN_134241-1 [Araneus ventricosus]
MEDKQTGIDENSKIVDVSGAEDCVFSLQKSLTHLEGKGGKMSGIDVEEYLTAADDLMVFARVTEGDILSSITDEMENDDEDHTDPSQSLLTYQETLQSVQSIRNFFQAFHDDHVRALESMQTLLVDLTVKQQE